MNKEKFLLELKEYLNILENREQEDILAEYAQHIDMKMSKGLSEEEAISDFGPMEELAAQILEAYHVKPAFYKKPALSFRIPKPKTDAEKPDKSLVKGAWERVKRMFFGMVRAVKSGFLRIGAKCRGIAAWTGNLFTGKREAEQEQECGSFAEKTKEKSDRKRGSLMTAVGRGIAAVWRWCLGVCIFWMKLMWNMAWILFGLFCAGMAAILLMGVGAIPIFLFQGYPFAGIFIICVGGLMCMCTLACGAFSLLIRRKKEDADAGREKKSGEEEVYEQTI